MFSKNARFANMMYIKQASMQVIPSIAIHLSFLCRRTIKYPAIACIIYIRNVVRHIDSALHEK